MLPIERVIAQSGLTIADGRARVEVRLPWYRSLPLSTVRIEKIALDGQEITLEDARFQLGELSVGAADLENLTEDFWFVLDSAFVSFSSVMELGSEHKIDVTIAIFPPYIPGMRRVNSQSEWLAAGEAK